MTDALVPQPSPSVPQSYAEKAMASLMQLHGELMEEKERRVELFRRLMEREQALAELKMYVKLLEQKVAGARPTPPAPARAPAPPPPVAASPAEPAAAARPPEQARPAGAEGWRTW